MLSKGAPRIRLDETLYVDVCAATAPRKEPRIVASVLQSCPKPAAVGPTIERGAQQRKPDAAAQRGGHATSQQLPHARIHR